MDVVSINIQYCGCHKSVKVNIVNNMCLHVCDTEQITLPCISGTQ